MIDKSKIWHEKDYNTYPESEWCDFDYMANAIRKTGYEVKTNMCNLIDTILSHYDSELYMAGKQYFAVEDTRPYPDSLMINVDDVMAFIEASGGLCEFDYE